ncbi:annexin A1a isoform X2 [Heterodontus francisci]|uniref:annexin A1a isoform X2 n=1 Tax=Heterodontus francisci TaxID=7792 RepID=UPI00355B636D
MSELKQTRESFYFLFFCIKNLFWNSRPAPYKMASNLVSALLQQTMHSSKYPSPSGPTVTPFPNFDASADATALNNALHAKGVDEATIINILTTRTNWQRQQIAADYQQSVGKQLKDVLQCKLSGKLETIALDLLQTPAQFDAHQLHSAIKCLGTDEDCLVEILVSRSNKEIKEIIKAFKEAFDCELEEKIKDDTSGVFQMALIALLKASRDESCAVDHDLADDDARALYEAGEKRKGTDVETFINILTSRNATHMQTVFERYTKYSKHEIDKALDLELKGDIENVLISLVKCMGNKPDYFAEKLYNSMKGYGTKDKVLIRIMISRSEVDLKDIKMAYKAKYGTTLYKAIEDDTKGDYEKILLALAGSNE